MMTNNLGSQNGSARVVSVLVVLVVVAVAGYFLMNRGSNDGTVNPLPSESVSPSQLVSVTPTSSPSSTAASNVSPSPTPKTTTLAQVKTFTVTGTSFAFSMKEIKANNGDTVKIVFNNAEGMHDWVIDEFNAKTVRIQAGQSATVTFVADKTGTFEYYCSVGNHRAQGMKGSLVVQ